MRGHIDTIMQESRGNEILLIAIFHALDLSFTCGRTRLPTPGAATGRIVVHERCSVRLADEHRRVVPSELTLTWA